MGRFKLGVPAHQPGWNKLDVLSTGIQAVLIPTRPSTGDTAAAAAQLRLTQFPGLFGDSAARRGRWLPDDHEDLIQQRVQSCLALAQAQTGDPPTSVGRKAMSIRSNGWTQL